MLLLQSTSYIFHIILSLYCPIPLYVGVPFAPPPLYHPLHPTASPCSSVPVAADHQLADPPPPFLPCPLCLQSTHPSHETPSERSSRALLSAQARPALSGEVVNTCRLMSAVRSFYGELLHGNGTVTTQQARIGWKCEGGGGGGL